MGIKYVPWKSESSYMEAYNLAQIRHAYSHIANGRYTDGMEVLASVISRMEANAAYNREGN